MKPHILFVDDEKNVLEALQRLLRIQHELWDMTFALSAEEAEAILAATSIDVIVSDVTMPCKDGLQFLQELQADERTSGIPVIILTGNHEQGLKQRALDLGATDLLSKPVSREELLSRLRSALRLKVYQDRIKAQNASLEQQILERTLQLTASRQEIIWRLAMAAEFRDEDTGHHVVRVGCYCRVLAESLGMDKDFIDQITLTSPLHDIGKIGVPDQILLKPGKLTLEEYRLMQQHCVIGKRILCDSPHAFKPYARWTGTDILHLMSEEPDRLIETAGTISLTHHEKWDGTGYPQGLKGEFIPLAARIVALADVYDALCSKRPYKPAFSVHRALEIIRESAGTHFDPAVHAAFEKSLDAVLAIQAEFPSDDSSYLENVA